MVQKKNVPPKKKRPPQKKSDQADSFCNESEISCPKFRHPTKGIGKKLLVQKKNAPRKKKNRKYFFLLIQIEIQRSGENLKKKSTTTFFPLLIFFLKTLSGLILVAMSQKSLASLLKKGIQTKTNFTCPQGGNKDPFD